MSNESPVPDLSATPADPLMVSTPVAPTAMAPAEAPAEPASRPLDAPDGRCPWCSAGLALGAGLASCPTCGAHLTGGEDAEMPGLTQVAPVSLKKVVSAEPVRRSRLLAWISGEVVDDVPPTDAPAAALAPPSRDVRREILRLELEAAGIQIPDELLAAPAPDATDAPPAAPADRESTAA